MIKTCIHWRQSIKKYDVCRDGVCNATANDTMRVRVTLGVAGDKGGDEGGDKGNLTSSLPLCHQGANIIIIGTLASAAEWQKIRRPSWAAGDKGDLVSSSLLLLDHNKIKKGKHRRPQTYFTQGV